MLPTDFDIFSSSSWTIPLCIQIRARGTPRAASVWAISFSWWGKTRSEPPPWIAKSGPSSLLGHRRALDVPAGPALPPGRGPAGVLVGLARLPEREVERVLLQRLGARLLALVHLVGVAVRELAVAVEAADAEVDVAARLIGVPGLDQRLDQGDDLRDRLRGQRLGVGAAEPEPVGVLDVGGGHLGRELDPRAAGLARGVVDLVVDVGDVDDELRLVALVRRKRRSSVKTTNGRALPMWMRP